MATQGSPVNETISLDEWAEQIPDDNYHLSGAIRCNALRAMWFPLFCMLSIGARRHAIGCLFQSRVDWQGVKSVCWCGVSPRSPIVSNSPFGNYSHFMQHKVDPWENWASLSTAVDVSNPEHRGGGGSIQYLFLGNWCNPPLTQGYNENTSCWQWGHCTLHLQPTQT